MRLSIITPVLNSHEILRRQVLHYRKIGLPPDVEVIIVDDGSAPPLEVEKPSSPPIIRVIRTNDFRPWTEMTAFNRGVERSSADYVLKIDVDYVVPEETIDAALRFTGDRMDFVRQFAVLDEHGQVRLDADTLRDWGLREKWIGKVVRGHRNQYLMRRDLFWELGGYDDTMSGKWRAASADSKFWRKWLRYSTTRNVSISEEKPLLYMFPNGHFCGDRDYNPHGMFHDLKRR